MGLIFLTSPVRVIADIMEIEYEVVGWNNLAQDADQ
jgi:hypothetical protein